MVIMCEFNVFLEGEQVFEEAIYFKREDDGTLLARDILGKEKKLGNVEIEEIDVSSEKLSLSNK